MKKVTMETSMGTITLELNDEKSPETVKNQKKQIPHLQQEYQYRAK